MKIVDVKAGHTSIHSNMHLYITTILFIIFEHINRIFTQGVPISPCPKMFQYRYDGAEWFGLLSVRNPDFADALHIKVTLSMRGKPSTHYLGEIELLTRGQYQSDAPVLYKVKFPKTHIPPKLLHIAANNHVVCVGAPDHGIFVTQIQLEHTRKFTFIGDETSLPMRPSLVNNDAFSEVTGVLPSNTKLLPFPTTAGNPMKSSRSNVRCGRIDNHIRLQAVRAAHAPLTADTATSTGNQDMHDASFKFHPRAQANSDRNHANGPLITAADSLPIELPPGIFHTDHDYVDGGDDVSPILNEQPSITRGMWPWLAAIYVNNLTSLAYQCSGTLISARVVITSAHCFHLFKKRYAANEVLVFLGRHNLKNWNEEGSLAAPVDDIFVHPDFDTHLNSYDADIAVVVLKHVVRFNSYIRPACLWFGSTDVQYIEGGRGTVVGWGLAATTAASTLTATIPRTIDAPIVSNDICFKANEQLRSLSSNRTFCAGVVAHSAMGTAAAKQAKVKSRPCTGDSGAGLMMLRSNRWFLRGIVSATLPAVDSQCSTSQYVLYTDVAKFLDWILAFII